MFVATWYVDFFGVVTYFEDEVVSLCSLMVSCLSCFWDAWHDVLGGVPWAEASWLASVAT